MEYKKTQQKKKPEPKPPPTFIIGEMVRLVGKVENNIFGYIERVMVIESGNKESIIQLSDGNRFRVQNFHIEKL